MIPVRSLSRESFDNGVRCRVDACRKRLRIIRVQQRAQIHIAGNPQLEEMASSLAESNEIPTATSEMLPPETRVGALAQEPLPLQMNVLSGQEQRGQEEAGIT